VKTSEAELQDMWARHSAEWRDTAQITSQYHEASEFDSRLLDWKASSGWWSLLQELGITLIVTREYEHLVVAMSAQSGRPVMTFLPMPHPSGLVIDRQKKTMYLASTRNPNQVYRLKPATGLLERSDIRGSNDSTSPFVPVSSAFYAGSLYLHDLALFAGELHANAAGHNAVVRLTADGGFERVWWPKCIENVFSSNHIQLNSTAAGATLRDSFYSASSCKVGRLRPGHLRYRVDKQGVIFSGRTREPMCGGLTRPHSARLRRGQVWVANSGYGELGIASDGKLEVTAKLPGWTRGLCLVKDVAFVATSRVMPKFAHYAPGLDSSRSRCGVHAVSCQTGRILASLEWPAGNQVFAIDWISDQVSPGFVFHWPRGKPRKEVAFFYRYLTEKKI
jgi:uncharacterized protein (TIGR03032 family)